MYDAIGIDAAEMAGWPVERITLFFDGLARAIRAATRTEADDRRQFIEGNAVILVAERDAKINRMRRELTKLNRRCRSLKLLNESLAQRVAAQSELLTRAAEKGPKQGPIEDAEFTEK